MKLYKVYTSQDLSSYIYIGTETPSLILTNYPNAYKVEQVDDLTVLS